MAGKRERIDRRLSAASPIVLDQPVDTVAVFRDGWGEVAKRYDLGKLGLPTDIAMLLADAFRNHHAASSSDTLRHCWMALRNALADNPHVAMTALLHKLVSDTFQHRMYKGVMEASVSHVFFPVQDDALKDSPSARAVHGRHEGWAGDIPAEDEPLWDWLTALDDASRMALLAHCVSYGVNALYEKPNPYGGNGVSQHSLDMRLGQADRLARATGLNMVDVGWRPTVSNYLGRVTKPRILQAVREGAGEQAAQLIDHLKKGDMAKEAERLLADTGWLPEPLRLVNKVQAPTTETGCEDDDAALARRIGA